MNTSFYHFQMSQSLKLKKSEREQIIFNHLRGKDDPLYEVSQTKYGKYVVKPKQVKVEIEEEEDINDESPAPEPVKQNPKTIPVKQQSVATNDKADARRERRKRNRRAKQDAKRILDALTNLINSNNGSDDDEQPQQAPPLVEPNNFNPINLSYNRRRLFF